MANLGIFVDQSAEPVVVSEATAVIMRVRRQNAMQGLWPGVFLWLVRLRACTR